MPSPVSLKYQGAAGPEALAEEVPFVFHPATAGIAGFASAVGAFFLLALLYAMLSAALGIFEFGHVAFLILSIVAIAMGTGVAWANWRTRRGREVRVGPAGIRVLRAGTLERECKWDRMAVVEIGRFGKVRRLTDEQGFELSTDLLGSRHPDAALARRVMLNVARDLHRPQLRPPQRRRRLVARNVAGGVMVAVGGAVLIASEHRFIDAVGSTHASASLRWLAVLLIGAAILAVGFFFMFSSLEYVEEPKAAVLWDSELAAFIADRKGRYETVDMPEGMWFRYVDAKALRSLEQGSPIGGVLLFFAALMALCAVLTYPQDVGSALFLGLLGLLIAILGTFAVRWGLQIRRLMGSRFRRTPDGFEVERRSRVIACRILRTPKTGRPAAKTPGAMAWVLRGDDGRIYRIDPRFIVEAGSRPNARSESS